MDVVRLTQQLIRFDSTNPPGNEGPCARFVAELLEGWGLEVSLVELAEGRPSVLARLRGADPALPLCFTGHLDTVPLGEAAWRRDPFGGEIEEGRLYGRGASDMKSGVAAMLGAVSELRCRRQRRRDVLLVLTVGEETGCEGAQVLASHGGCLPQAGALVIAEPTANAVALAHKGAVRLRVEFHGRSAHGSMPEAGRSAILTAAKGALALAGLDFEQPPHALLGRPTVNVGTMHGGTAINMVPDHAELGVDIRTVPGLAIEAVLQRVQAAIGAEATVTVTRAASPVATPGEVPWVQRVLTIASKHAPGQIRPSGMPYFTDASYLLPALGAPPAVVLGPGVPSQAHATDEWCECEAIRLAAAIYLELCEDWCVG